MGARIPRINLCPRCGSPTTLASDDVQIERCCTRCGWASLNGHPVKPVTGPIKVCRGCGRYVGASMRSLLRKGYCESCQALGRIPVKISEITEGMSFTLEAKVVHIGPSHDIETKYGLTKVTQATLEDDSGKIALNLWGDQFCGLNVGDTVKTTNGYAKSFRGQLQVNVGKKGSIERVNPKPSS